MTAQERRSEALTRAVTGQTWSNYPAIFDGFIQKGIPESEIRPRENVFTYEAWRALGRQVRRGEHGVKVITYITCENGKKDSQAAQDGQTENQESQTCPDIREVPPALDNNRVPCLADRPDQRQAIGLARRPLPAVAGRLGTLRKVSRNHV
jgi:hypothetical protein